MRSLRVLFIVLMLGLALGLSQETGSMAVEMKESPGDWPFEGDYHLLCIAIDDYVHWPKLSNSVADAEALAKVLVREYGFGPERVVKLYDAQATEREMMQALRNLTRRLRPEDWLLIFFAGHSAYDEQSKMGAWVPVDARRDDESQWLSNGWVRSILRAIPARHLLMICDSGFVASNSPEAAASVTRRSLDRRHVFKRTSREVIVSGWPGSVKNERIGGHSVFANALLKTLDDNIEPYLTASELHERMRRDIASNEREQVKLSVIQGTGSQVGGSFVLVRGRQMELVELDRMIEQKQQRLQDLKKRQAEIDALNSERQLKLREKRRKLAELEAEIDKLSKSFLVEAKKPGEAFLEPNTGMQFVWIPGGCFNMGSPSTDKAKEDDEGPVHEVSIDGFWMGKFEVTNAQYRTFKPKHNSGSYEGFSRNGADQPVVYVSWDDAKAFAKHLSAQQGGRYEFRLPTEAEWEYACRAGTTTRYHWGDKIDARYANLADKNHPTHPKHPHLDDGYPVTSPVGSLKPNAFGLYDMAGNVVEWCEDWYASDAYQDHSHDNPTGPLTGTSRVMRGGSYWAWAWNCRCADRGSDPPEKRRSALGFRLVMKEKK